MSTHIGAGSVNFGTPSPVLGCLFAFNLSLKPETFTDKFIKAQLAIPPEQRINLVCILNQMTIIHFDQVFHLWDQTSTKLDNSFVFFESEKDSLLSFTLCLLRVLAEVRFGLPDLFKHYFSGGSALNFPMKYFGLK